MMTTETPQGTDATSDCPPPPPTASGCDPQLVEDMACKASGVAAQAAYNATYQALLATARQDYDKTRTEYRSKRHDAMLQVQDMRHQIKHLIERIKCLIEQKRVWRCLDDAYCKIVEELKCCDTATGCCADECEFDVDDVESVDCDQLVQLIADYQRQTDKAKDCFGKLVLEPAALVQRLADAKAAIDAINAALGADPATTDLKKVYVQAIVAKRDIDRIWNGFDQTHDFVDCLCRALTCWTKGCAAVSVLTGAKAVCDCKQKAKAAHCDRLKTNTVDEILAMYDKLCPPHDDCEDDVGSDTDHDDNSSCDDDGNEDNDDGDELDVCDECGHRHPPHGHGKGRGRE
jgi:hypothetical protein